MQEQLIKIFQDTKSNNPDSSLDELLYQAFNEVKENDTDSFDEFRKLILDANGINEYEHYTKNVRPEIKRYIEETIFLEYSIYSSSVTTTDSSVSLGEEISA